MVMPSGSGMVQLNQPHRQDPTVQHGHGDGAGQFAKDLEKTSGATAGSFPVARKICLGGASGPSGARN
jgi:hypothetical protein